MTREGARTFGLVIASVTCLIAAASLIVYLQIPDIGSDFASSPLAQIGGILAVLALAALGWVLATRRTENPIGWLFSASGATFALGTLIENYIQLSASRLTHLPAAGWFAWMGQWLTPVGLWAPILLLLLLFPNGRLPSRRWRPLAWLITAALVGLAGSGMFRPGRPALGLANPLFTRGSSVATTVGDFAWLLLGIGLLGAAASLLFRFGGSTGVGRQQLKWLALSAGFIVLGVAVNLATNFLAPQLRQDSLLTEWAGAILIGVGLSSIPVTAGIAILRYRLYDIDVIINRTLVYGVLTASLLTSYLLIVVTLSRVLDPLTRDSDIAVAASTLAVAALFGPLRRRIQGFVDRRFYRAKYDAARALNAFSAGLRDEVNVAVVSSQVIGVVGQTVQPKQVSLWLRETQP
ncbi:MAG: hypothetical protein ABR505_02965 [Actinomycetota bacterium]